MKKKIIGIFIIITMLAIVPITIFAYSGINTDITIGGDAAKSSEVITGRIVGVLQTVGTVISVIALIIIGMRYMFSSIEDKAQMKGVLGYYITGCVLVFATSNVLGFAYDVINDVQHSYVDVPNSKVLSTCVKQGTIKRQCTGAGGLCDCTSAEPTIIEISLPLDTIGGHSFPNSWTTEKDPTCIEEGMKTKTCKNGCGAKQSESIAKLDHSYVDNYVAATQEYCRLY